MALFFSLCVCYLQDALGRMPGHDAEGAEPLSTSKTLLQVEEAATSNAQFGYIENLNLL